MNGVYTELHAPVDNVFSEAPQYEYHSKHEQARKTVQKKKEEDEEPINIYGTAGTTVMYLCMRFVSSISFYSLSFCL